MDAKINVASENERNMAPLMDAVVKVFCVHSAPNHSQPWQRKMAYKSTSSGLIISGRKVLTNAHCVKYYTQVKLRKRGSGVKYLAKVLAIGDECDLAMLTVEDDEFWEDVSPVEFGSLPGLQDAVSVVGYPVGGDTISITSGVVSRIETFPYIQGSTELLGIQIDAAINAGNSGGPAFSDEGKCVGIAFQSIKDEDVENMGYVIPMSVVMHFIKDYEKNGKYTGFPTLGFKWKTMEHPDFRIAKGMSSKQTGVLVKTIAPTSPEFHVLKPSDIILSFDGIDIANDGTVLFTHGERIGFSYLVSQKYTGMSPLLSIKLPARVPLVPLNIGAPSYYIVAGFVFTVVSIPYMDSAKCLHGMPQSKDEQLVVISQVLEADDINVGSEGVTNLQVLAFNGNPVRNLKSLAMMVDKCEDEFLRFKLDCDEEIILRTKTAKKASEDILSTYAIPSAMSSDLRT
ncbi:hypothetical protein MKX03_017412 [Papaver bracteatum]|nr:hypothetical protein MKX03_017412 [Papaver bracteatum]